MLASSLTDWALTEFRERVHAPTGDEVWKGGITETVEERIELANLEKWRAPMG
jgi:hypothetical protein